MDILRIDGSPGNVLRKQMTTSMPQELHLAVEQDLCLPHEAFPNVFKRRFALFIKRMLDIVLSAALHILLAPLFVIIVIAIKLDSAGPAIFIQERWGIHTRRFKMFKFRTLRHNSPDPHARYEMIECDPRITCIGSFLRRTSLDELPQLTNVLLGTMSIVGPRPLVPWESEQCLAHHRERFSVKPGITGLSQVYARNAVNLSARSDLDLVYVKQWSLLLDLKILLISPFKIVAQDDIYPRKKHYNNTASNEE